MNAGKINSELRICHFLAQVRQEVGPRLTLSENHNYREAALKGTFLFYRNHPDLIRLHAYDPAQKKPADQRAIANHAYANRMGNGNAQSEDGWRYRGRGMIQLTGRENHTLLQSRYAKLWPEGVDFIDNPDILQEPVYALRSALVTVHDVTCAGRSFHVPVIRGVIETGISTGERLEYFVLESVDGHHVPLKSFSSFKVLDRETGKVISQHILASDTKNSISNLCRYIQNDGEHDSPLILANH